MTWSYSPDLSITSLPALVKNRVGGSTALFIRNDDGRDLSFRDFWELAGRLAGALKAAGVEPNDRVTVQVDKSPEALALFLACARLGAIFVPLNTAYTLAELDHFLGDARPAAVVAAPSRISELAPLAKGHGARATLTLGTGGDGSLMDAASRHSAGYADHATNWDDTVAILYTSGTTGRSKGAMLTHGNLASNALSLIDAWRFTAHDVLFHALPVYHTHGLFTASNTLLLCGGSMLFRRKFDADDCLRCLPQATAMMGVPTFYTRLLQQPGLTRAAVAHMRVFISGSAPLLAETHRDFAARTGHAILERYGMTETNMNTSNPYDGERRAGTVGFPLPGIEARIADPETGKPAARGEIGMIELRGPNVFKGYWQMPEKTAAEFRSDGFFITGDLGRFDADGYLSIVGRGKDLIITGGFNVYPKEVETEIDTLPGVVESAVIGLPHPDFGEGVTAVVVVSDGAAADEATLAAALRQRLAHFKLPKRVLFVEELPRNAMGKVQKNVLRERYAGLFVGRVSDA
jgi:malonyl-CoA/methylmalonyl-CoA synthetase